MYKLKIASLLLSCTLLFTGCSLLPWNWEYWDRKEPRVERMSGDTGVIAETRFEIILTAIENKDAEAIKAMFSTTALAEAQDIDGAIDYLFNLFDGEVVSWELKSNSTGRTYGEGGSHELIRSFFDVYTKKSRYKFLTLDYNKNTENPDMQGMYALCGINATFARTQWGSWQDLKIPGVYWPKGMGGPHTLNE